MTFFTFLTFFQICQNHPISGKPKKHHFLLFPHTMTTIRFSPFLPNSPKYPKMGKIAKMRKIGKIGKMGKMGRSAKMPKIPPNGKIPKNGVFREIPQNWDFGDRGGEHTRKAWCGNYFQNNPWAPILYTSIEGVYFTLFVSYWFSINFIFGYFIKVEENVTKWKKMVVDVQNEGV